MPAIPPADRHQGTVVHADESPGWNKLHAQVRHAAHQPPGRLQHRRCLHQCGGVLFTPACAVASSGITTISPGRISFAYAPGGSLAGGTYPARTSATASRHAECCPSGDAKLRRPSVDFCGYWQRARAA